MVTVRLNRFNNLIILIMYEMTKSKVTNMLDSGRIHNFTAE
jgi:hypothetical protein